MHTIPTYQLISGSNTPPPQLPAAALGVKLTPTNVTSRLESQFSFNTVPVSSASVDVNVESFDDLEELDELDEFDESEAAESDERGEAVESAEESADKSEESEESE